MDNVSFKYGMKAAADSIAQIRDRISKFNILRLRPVIELFLRGLKYMDGHCKAEIAKICSQFPECQFFVHFPIASSKDRYIFDPHNKETNAQIRLALDFCCFIGSKALITHRCFGFNTCMGKRIAQQEFAERIICWDKMARERNIRIFIENYGFVWLPKGFAKHFISSPLDHFFPWEIANFHEEVILGRNARNIGIVLDLAHAVLSSNMYNFIKEYPHLRGDARFSNISDEDLSRVNHLCCEDFIFDFIDYFHVSDAFVWKKNQGLNNINKFIFSEGLPIGTGNIDYRNIFRMIANKQATLIMEINSTSEDEENNFDQFEAVRLFRNMLK